MLYRTDWSNVVCLVDLCRQVLQVLPFYLIIGIVTNVLNAISGQFLCLF